MKLSTLQWDAIKAGKTLLPDDPSGSPGQIAVTHRSGWRTACAAGVIAVGSGVGAASLSVLPTGAVTQPTTQTSPSVDVNTSAFIASPVATSAKQPFAPPQRPLVELSSLPITSTGETPSLWRELERRTL